MTRLDFIPGTLCDARMWSRLLPLLGEQYACQHVPLHEAQTRQQMHALISQHSAERAHLVAFSLGAYLALEYALAHPSMAALTACYLQVRRHTLALAEPLSDEDCGAQSMTDASPVKWHLAHTTWFFETFILERYEPDFAPFQRAFRVLFNSYYNGIGEKHPRAQRGLLTRPSMAQVRAYRANVDQRMQQLLARSSTGEAAAQAELATLVTLGVQHEQQHQELLLTDVKHLLAQSALLPAYLELALARAGAAPAAQWLRFDGGLTEIGFQGPGFCFDNELPRHRQYVAPFELASQLVTNGEYLTFIAAGGYSQAALWLAEGWDWVRQQQLPYPSCPRAWSHYPRTSLSKLYLL